MTVALIDHSSAWLVGKFDLPDVQAFLRLILGLTNWDGTGGVDEQVSEVNIASPPVTINLVIDFDAI